MPARTQLRRVVLILAMVGAMLVLAAPAPASNIPETGDRISLLAPPTTFPANTAFHVSHGFSCDFSEAGCPQDLMSGWLFGLYVDGVLQPSQSTVVADSGGAVKIWLTNFPNGLPTGNHTLVGVWSQDGVIVQTATAKIKFK